MEVFYIKQELPINGQIRAKEVQLIGDNGEKIGIISAVIYGIYGLTLAIISELVQLTANNRGPGINDVLIDYSGYLAGMLIFILIVFICYFVKKKKSMKNKELNSL